MPEVIADGSGSTLFLQHKISPVPSTEYGERFFAFLKAVMRGGEGGERFMPKEDQGKGKEKAEPEEEKARAEAGQTQDQVQAEGSKAQ